MTTSSPGELPGDATPTKKSCQRKVRGAKRLKRSAPLVCKKQIAQKEKAPEGALSIA